jgi:inosine/xanthosine triphosphatase
LNTKHSCSMRLAGIATGNKGKVRSVTRVLADFCGLHPEKLLVLSPPDNLPRQPVGSLEVYSGALRRAYHAWKRLPEPGYGIGVEAGLIEFYVHNGFLEGQIAVVIDPSGRVSVGLSQFFPLPTNIVEGMKKGRELSDYLTERNSVGHVRHHIGYIGLATWGAVTREDLTYQAVLMALLPWIQGWSYELENVDTVLSSLRTAEGTVKP